MNFKKQFTWLIKYPLLQVKGFAFGVQVKIFPFYVEHDEQTPLAPKKYPDWHWVATVAEVQFKALLPQATQVCKTVKNPWLTQAELQA